MADWQKNDLAFQNQRAPVSNVYFQMLEAMRLEVTCLACWVALVQGMYVILALI
jgi:hypothetical protein